MVKFDESKVINALHTERAKVGKEYYFFDTVYELKKKVEEKDRHNLGTLESVGCDAEYPFKKLGGHIWSLIYPYEEPLNKRMTNLMFIEWVAKGNGMYSRKASPTINIGIICGRDSLNEEVDEDIVIRPWDSDEWIEPTVDIYERDCE